METVKVVWYEMVIHDTLSVFTKLTLMDTWNGFRLSNKTDSCLATFKMC